MKKIYYIGAIFGLMFLYIIPIGRTTSGNVYLGLGQSKILHFSVKGGDVIKGEYSTNPSLSLIIAWGYGSSNGIMAQDTSQGTFTLNINDGEGDCVFTFTNLGINGGNLQYNVYVVRGAASTPSIPSFNIFLIIGVLGIIGFIITRKLRKFI